MENIKLLEVIQDELPIRLSNLTKYAPFFQIANIKKYKGKYDVGVISLGIMSYMLLEGKLLDKGLEFEKIQTYIEHATLNYYGDALSKVDSEDMTRDILNYMQNKGGPFSHNYYDVIRKTEVDKKVRYIERKYDRIQNKNLYSLTSEGVDFFLQLKEFGEESRVTITLLLLRKLVSSGNFESAINTISNLNIEIRKEIRRKNEILEELTYNVYDGYEKYTYNAREKLEEEQGLFRDTIHTLTTIETEYLEKIEKNQITEKELKLKSYVTDMKIELSKSVEIHSRLLAAVIELREKSDEILTFKRKNILKETLNFNLLLDKSIQNDSVIPMEIFSKVLFRPKLKKSFNIKKIDDIFLWKLPKSEVGEDEVTEDDETVKLETIDNQVSNRIVHNFNLYLKLLLNLLVIKRDFDLNYFFDEVYRKYGMDGITNTDLVTLVLTVSKIKGNSNGYKEYDYKKIDLNNFKEDDFETLMINIITNDKSLEELKHTPFVFEAQKGEYAVFDTVEITNFRYYIKERLL